MKASCAPLMLRRKLTRGSAIWISALQLGFCGPGLFNAGASTMRMAVDKPGHAISPTLYGIFFEDINCSADGGLYAELVRNRNFEDSDNPDYWKSLTSDGGDVTLSIDTSQPVSRKNPRSLTKLPK